MTVWWKSKSSISTPEIYPSVTNPLLRIAKDLESHLQRHYSQRKLARFVQAFTQEAVSELKQYSVRLDTALELFKVCLSSGLDGYVLITFYVFPYQFEATTHIWIEVEQIMSILLEQRQQGNIARGMGAPQASPQRVQARTPMPRSTGDPTPLDICRCTGNFHDEYCLAQYFVIEYVPINGPQEVGVVSTADIFAFLAGIDTRMSGYWFLRKWSTWGIPGALLSTTTI